MSTKLYKNNERVLFISDMHIPYQHPDTFAFLKALKKHIKPTRVVCGGDEIDAHAMSFHDSDPDLPNAGDELELAKIELAALYKIFPKMDLIDSNHGSMLYRKGKHHGIPRAMLKGYNEILDAPKGWVWHDDITLDYKGSQTFVTHGMAANVMNLTSQYGMNAVQFHYHSTFSIGYISNPNNLLFGMQCGCLVDQKSMAFAYAKLFRKRFIIGTGAMINGVPRLFPMLLNEDSRWNGKII